MSQRGVILGSQPDAAQLVEALDVERAARADAVHTAQIVSNAAIGLFLALYHALGKPGEDIGGIEALTFPMTPEQLEGMAARWRLSLVPTADGGLAVSLEPTEPPAPAGEGATT